MNKIGDICYPTGKYQDRQSGEEKTRWSRCGVLLQKEDGSYRIKLDLIPFAGAEGWFAVFEQKEQQTKPAAQPAAGFRQPAQPAQQPLADEDDIPW